MNCKPGDLAILLSARNDQVKKFVGQIHRVGVASTFYAEAWKFDPPLMLGDREVSWADAHMRPIRNPGDDAVDESRAWLPPVPTSTKERETA